MNGSRKKHLKQLRESGISLGYTHSPFSCIDPERCCIHNPSDHSMRSFPMHWRRDRQLMERICPHGIGHPDPDHMHYVRAVRGGKLAQLEGIHGCDECCCRSHTLIEVSF